jgi:hypothetical protein
MKAIPAQGLKRHRDASAWVLEPFKGGLDMSAGGMDFELTDDPGADLQVGRGAGVEVR